ncbi:MAG: L-fucose:H+ symporter permease, partial [Planctomycetota bacterium]
DFQTSWIQIAFYGSYFCLALPAAIFTTKFSYKVGVLVGLGMYIVGALMFFPASQTMNYFHFLAALYVLAGGLSFLETAANPYVIAMGPEETGTRRLNLAQSFNPLGSISGVLISKFFILSSLNQASSEDRAAMSADALQAVQQEELSAVMGPYVGLAIFLFVIWVAILVIRMPKASDDEIPPLSESCGFLRGQPSYVWGGISPFVYVGAPICVWSYTIRYVMAEVGLNESAASTYYLGSLILFVASRFVCTALMQFIPPSRLLFALAVLAIALSVGTMFASGYTGVFCLVGISGCMSLMFPTIFGLSVHGLGKHTKIGGSGQIMAILGGAVITAIQGQVSDATDIKIAFIVPAICFALIAYYALFEVSRGERQSAPLQVA